MRVRAGTGTWNTWKYRCEGVPFVQHEQTPFCHLLNRPAKLLKDLLAAHRSSYIPTKRLR